MPFKRATQTWHRTQRPPISVGNFLILVTLLTGLLNFPSMSTSGAELSHPHSLFMLAHHHHDHDGEIDDVADHHTSSHPDINPPVASSASDGPVLQQPAAEFVGGGPIGLTLGRPTDHGISRSSNDTEFIIERSPAGLTDQPETPPPRV